MAAALPPCGLMKQELKENKWIDARGRCSAEYGPKRPDGTYAVCGEPYANHFSSPVTSSSSSGVPIAHPVYRPVKAGDPADRLYPIFRCSFINSESDVRTDVGEALIDTGNLRCDLLLPARDAFKLGLRLDKSIAPQAATGVTGHTSQLLTCAPAVKVEFSLKAEDSDAIQVKRGLLIACVLDIEYKKFLEKKSEESAKPSVTDSSSTPSATASISAAETAHDSPPLPSIRSSTLPLNVSPIKDVTGTAKGRVILGESGMHRLDLSYHAGSRTISLIEEPLPI